MSDLPMNEYIQFEEYKRFIANYVDDYSNQWTVDLRGIPEVVYPIIEELKLALKAIPEEDSEKFQEVWQEVMALYDEFQNENEAEMDQDPLQQVKDLYGALLDENEDEPEQISGENLNTFLELQVSVSLVLANPEIRHVVLIDFDPLIYNGRHLYTFILSSPGSDFPVRVTEIQGNVAWRDQQSKHEKRVWIQRKGDVAPAEYRITEGGVFEII